MKQLQLPQFHETSDYSLFIPGSIQRTILPGHIKDLVESMRRNGFFHDCPIRVEREGGKFRIINGHHRLEAAKTLGIPVLFIITEQSSGTVVADGNISKAWNLTDWCVMYATQGKESYAMLHNYTRKGIPIRAAASMLTGNCAGTGSGIDQVIKSGTLTIRDTSQIDMIVSIVTDLGEACPTVKSKHFIDVASMCHFASGFNASQLKARIKTYPMLLARATCRDQMLEQVDHIYNYKSGVKVPLALMAKEAMARRDPTRKRGAA